MEKNGSTEALLAVDIGNTTVSVGCLITKPGSCEVVCTERFPTGSGTNETVVCRSLTKLAECASERLSGEHRFGEALSEEDRSGDIKENNAPVRLRIEGIVISSVVPAVTESVKKAALDFSRTLNAGGKDPEKEEYAGEVPQQSADEPAISAVVKDADEPAIPVVIITSKSLTGLIFRSIDMSTLGHDRIVDAAWAAANVKLPAVTVDMGTATTFNVIDEGGIFLGGMIAAGIRTGLWGLNQRTAALPIPKERQPNGLIGKKTVDCLLSGAYNGSAAMIDGMVSRVEEELGKPVTLVMTGGHAITVRNLCRHEVVYEPNLLMKGLAFLFEKNVPRNV